MTAKTMAEVIQEAIENTPYWIEGDPGTHQDPYANAAAALSAAGFGLVADAKAPEIRYATLTSGETELDEVVATNATVHLEAMDDNHWWLLVESGGETVHVNFYTKRAKISGHAEVDS